ncbi:Rz1-like lysis system protein LysC [Budvicia aquatica]|uniref:Rz1-like lysis system protein LysC n=1 Tax=Budvicia aquatica TaxID=82979 RepID=UPI00200AC210|nr:Rz1-like lysis system protein LysC [Budvicia aquatica]
MLSGCANDPPSTARPIIVNGCPSVTACQFPAQNPFTNGDLDDVANQLELALYQCAEKVDMILNCQRDINNDKAGFSEGYAQ